MRGQTSVCMNLEKLEAGLKVRHGEELDGEEAHAADENTQERCVAAVLPNSPQEKLGHNREAVEKGEAAAAATTTTTTATKQQLFPATSACLIHINTAIQLSKQANNSASVWCLAFFHFVQEAKHYNDIHQLSKESLWSKTVRVEDTLLFALLA